MVLTDNSNDTGRSNSTVQITRRFKKLRKAQRKKALEHAASISTATFRRTSSHIASGYPDDHSLVVSRIAPVNGGASVRSSRSSNVEGDDESVATAKKDNTTGPKWKYLLLPLAFLSKPHVQWPRQMLE